MAEGDISHSVESACNKDLKDDPESLQPEAAVRPFFCKSEAALVTAPQSFGTGASPESSWCGLCHSEGTAEAGSTKVFPVSDAEKAEWWTGSETFQEQLITVKMEPSLGNSPFSNCSPADRKFDLAWTATANCSTQRASFHHPSSETSVQATGSLEGTHEDEDKHLGLQPASSLASVLPEIQGGPIPGFKRNFNQSTTDIPSIVELPPVGYSAKFSKKLEKDNGVQPDAAKILVKGAESSLKNGIPSRLGGKPPARADSDESSTMHMDVNVADIDVMEQERILLSIAEDRRQMEIALARSLAKKRQSSLASFLRKEKLEQPAKC